MTMKTWSEIGYRAAGARTDGFDMRGIDVLLLPAIIVQVLLTVYVVKTLRSKWAAGCLTITSWGRRDI
jgi:hypothetical protein